MHLHTLRRLRLKSALLACVAGLAAPAFPALAQAGIQAGTPAPEGQPDPRALLELMVNKGLVTREEADQLIVQATPRAAPVQAAIPAGGVVGEVQTVPYIPQVVRTQIKNELRAELAGQAEAEGWARPGEVAEWTQRITLSGDIRVRGEAVMMDEGNFDLAFPDFGVINSGSGYDVSPSNPQAAPFLNSTEDRRYARIRARLGANIRLDDRIAAEVRVATGSGSSPVSTNQTLGANGEFGKYALWLDRANLQFTPMEGMRVDIGRADNPFWTSELLFDEDLNFDGVSLRYATQPTDGVSLFGTVGAFPIFNTDFNFGSNEAGAFASRDKYLLGAQFGGDFAANRDVQVKVAVGVFHFENIQGERSSPCFFDQDVCDTDASRPAFQQFGNSLFPIRDVIPDTVDPIGSPEVQYFGLASEFDLINIRGQMDLKMFSPVGVRLQADFVRNVAFDQGLVAGRAINNLGPSVEVPNPNPDNNPNTDDETITLAGPWDGGDIGWSAGLVVGMPDLVETGDWRITAGYRWVESDAVLDAFTDSDFHLGGTNAKGWLLGGAYAIGRKVSVGARWLSSDSISGVPFSNDIVQFDLNSKF